MTHKKYSGCLAGVLGLAALTGCGDDDPPRNRYYVAAESAFQGCAFADCHAAGGKGDVAAMFPFGTATAAGDFRTALVDVPSCEYNLMPRVTPGDPDNSWLWIKLTGEYQRTGIEAGYLTFTPDAAWSEADKCNATIRGFGKRMPDVAPFTLDSAKLAAIREWIEVGAPGPNDPETTDAGM